MFSNWERERKVELPFWFLLAQNDDDDDDDDGHIFIIIKNFFGLGIE
mgnify:CR=1 FL=1